jgi:putative DNA primase/helicase
MSIDFDRINQAALGSLESLLCEWFPAGKKDGHEFRVGDLAGSPGSSLSINLNSGVWCDFAGSDKGSDPISLLAAIRGCKQGEAARELDQRLGAGGLYAKAPLGSFDKPRVSSDEWEALPHSPDGCHEPDTKHYKHGAPAATWTYHDAEGRRVGFIHRFNLEDGSKEVMPMTWCRNKATGREAWRFKSFAKPRPLYRLPDLVARPDAWVLIVEGEKAADAAQRLLPHIVCTTWAGGSKAVDIADWSVLAGRRVLIWPDNDEPGFKAAAAIHKHLDNPRIVIPPDDKADGWDLADAEAEGWTTDQVRAHIKAKHPAANPRKDAEVSPAQSPQATPPPPEVLEAKDYAATGEPADEDTSDYGEHPASPPDHLPPEMEVKWPFRVLGHDDGIYYYLPDSSQQIVSLTANDHKHLPFLRLAGANWWEATFPAKEGADWKAAANALIQRCHAEGIFTPRRVRGRGCWIDGDHVLFHAGDRLIIGNEERKIPTWASRWIYEQGQRMEADQAQPLPNAEAARLLQLTELMNWKEPIFAKFFAGWCVIAPICGVLSWRPHVWVNGPSGSGKTWLLNNILDPLVGRLALQVQSATTEAGIRQSLRSDALPVIFDEAESEDKRGQMRMQSILELARQASAETGAGIIKGSASGRAQEFQIRSCFAFASIGVAATLRADTSRITSLELKKDNTTTGQERFDQLKRLWAETIALPGWAESIRARSLSNAMTITNNARAFAKAVAIKLGDQRIGDQLGALLAGAFSLTSTRQLSHDEATEWVEKQNWRGFLPDDADQDEVRALSWMLDKSIRFETEEGKAYTRGIGELIQQYYSDAIRTDDAESIRANLMRSGIKVDADTVSISNHHPALRTLFENTTWADKWKDQMARVPGAVQIAGCRFGASTHRVVRIPKEQFLND